MAARVGSQSPGPDAVLYGQGASQDHVDDLLAQYGGISASQGSLNAVNWSPAAPRRNQVGGAPSPHYSPRHSPQRSPYLPQSSRPPPHPSQLAYSPHYPGHFAPGGGFESDDNVVSSWSNIPAQLQSEEESKWQIIIVNVVYECNLQVWLV